VTSPEVDGYLDALEPERRAVLAPVVQLVRDSVPPGYEESVSHGMPTWSVPLSRLPETYNGEPLMLLAVAAQKRHSSLYLMGLYADPDRQAEFARRWTATGRRLDMGKSCLRFRTLADLDLDLLSEVIGSVSVDEHVDAYQRSRSR
jgi:uncharacterized protein YdhG (YjbR/CyaY superfamily)